MSFCTEVKNELLNLRLSRCCPPAYTYGFMLFARSFSIKRICLQTANEEVAKGYCKAVFETYGVTPQITKGGRLRPTFVAEALVNYANLMIENGGNLGAIFNASNEVAVHAFLDHKIPFLAIDRIIGETFNRVKYIKNPGLKSLVSTHKKATKVALELVKEESKQW